MENRKPCFQERFAIYAWGALSLIRIDACWLWFSKRVRACRHSKGYREIRGNVVASGFIAHRIVYVVRKHSQSAFSSDLKEAEKDWRSMAVTGAFMARYVVCDGILPDKRHFWRWHINPMSNIGRLSAARIVCGSKRHRVLIVGVDISIQCAAHKQFPMGRCRPFRVCWTHRRACS